MTAAVETRSEFQLLDPLTQAERDDLRRSILRHGCYVPVIIDEDGNILDGHNRVDICNELGVGYTVDQRFGLSHEEKVALVLELNDVRRQRSFRTRAERDARIVELRREGLSTTLIAEEVGVDPSTVENALSTSEVSEVEEVIGKDGKTRPAKQPDRSAEAVAERRERITALRDSGATVPEMAEALGITTSGVYQILRKLPTQHDDQPVDRYERVKELAASGYSSRQIAADVGISEEALRRNCRERGIDIPADALLHRRRRPDSNRIVRETVESLEGLVIGIELAEIEDLDPEEIGDWAASLTNSLNALKRFHKKMKEAAQ